MPNCVKTHEIRTDNGMLRRRKPLCLAPRQSENGKDFSVHFDDLGIPLADSSLEELEVQIKEVLKIAWETYEVVEFIRTTPTTSTRRDGTLETAWKIVWGLPDIFLFQLRNLSERS